MLVSVMLGLIPHAEECDVRVDTSWSVMLGLITHASECDVRIDNSC